MNKTLIFSQTPFPRSMLLLFWPRLLLLQLTSLPCALCKHHSTINYPLPIICFHFCHLPVYFPFFSFFLRKCDSSSYLFSHWNLEIKLPISLHTMFFPNHHFHIFRISWSHCENLNFFWSALSLHRRVPRECQLYLSWMGYIWLLYMVRLQYSLHLL